MHIVVDPIAKPSPSSPAPSSAPFPSPPSPSTSEYLESAATDKAALLLEAGNNTAALTVLRRLTASFGDTNSDAHHLRGLALRTSDGESAARHVETAISMDPGVAFYHSNLGSILNELGQTLKAANAYLEGIRLNPLEQLGSGDGEVVLSMFRAAGLFEEEEEAFNVICTGADLINLKNRLPEVPSDHPIVSKIADLFSSHARILSGQGDAEGTVAWMSESVALVPGDGERRLGLGAGLEKAGRGEDALREFFRVREEKGWEEGGKGVLMGGLGS